MNFREFGLFRLTSDGRLECAFIPFVVLLRPLLNCGGVDKINLKHAMLNWQTFEQFMATFRQVKSVVYSGSPVSLHEFHDGARFGPIRSTQILEPNSRRIVDSKDYCDGYCEGIVRAKDIVINGSVFSGKISARVHVIVAEEDIQCNEVIQCKLLQASHISQSTYDKERSEAVGDSDVFLLITTGEVDTVTLPARCGIVSKAKFDNYFGIFASRAQRYRT